MIHEPAMVILELAARRGWNVAYTQGEDTGRHPWVAVEARRLDSPRIHICWHTRNTGTFRLFYCLMDGSDVSLKKAREAITERPQP